MTDVQSVVDAMTSDSHTHHSALSARSRLTRVFPFALLLGLCLLVQGATTATAKEGLDDLRERERQIKAERAAKAVSLDVVQEEHKEVIAALAAVNENVSALEAALSDADRALADAENEVLWNEARVATLSQEIDLIRGGLRRASISAYVNSRAGDLDELLAADDPNNVVKRRVLGDVRAGNETEFLESLRVATEDLAEARRSADEAVAIAQKKRAEIAVRFSSVVEARVQQQTFVNEVEDRLESALAEAASLQRADAELASRISGEEESIALRIEADRRRAEADAREGVLKARAEAEALARGDAVEDTNDRAGAPREDMRKVGDIWIHESMADDLRRLLQDARVDGVVMSGWGYRSSARQIELRREHCGTSNFAIYQMRSSRCRPPTARPGKSMHEQGKAVDFTQNGRVLTRNSSGYKWLKEHGADYGFKNLPSEAWHWSQNGN